MEFQISEHVKLVVNFEIGEKVLISGYGPKLDGEHVILGMEPKPYGCQSGIRVMVDRFNDWLDLGWMTKID